MGVMRMVDFFQAVRRDGHGALSSLNELDDVNIRNDDGENLLHVAIAYSNVDAAVDLIQRGVDVNAQDRKGATPLHYAGAHQNAMVAQQILDHGGDFGVVDEHGNTPLWTAVFNARGKYDVVNVLLAKGAAKTAHQKNRHGRSPIDFATQIGDTELVKLMENNS
ncbi:ankyrin repeat domain-containing protein [Bremerella cremea]|uniref:Ankyrin repeat domain-containing protein n=2 Tax=Bremerella cremea TaxID=1031537 RepID=A0A368KMZ8_9BACT|nr:ankyrin repeat domain-containing protein [Bremerella cremea]